MVTTSINGIPAVWTDEIQREWDAHADGRPPGEVLSVNYFTPRPYVDEYNRGDVKTGFVYTIKDGMYSEPQVLYVTWYENNETGERTYTQMFVMEPKKYPWLVKKAGQ